MNAVEILDFFKSDRQALLTAQIEEADWTAARFLAKLLKEGSFHETLGEGTIFLLMEDEHLAAFITLTEKDCIDDASMTPWLGFLYTFPEYRGRGCARQLLEHGVREAGEKGYCKVYLATDHIGFYEGYGFSYLENRVDVWGKDSRIYVRNSLEMQRKSKPAFSVIGKEGTTADGPGFIPKLWDDANAHFDEVASLAMKDSQGALAGVWGAMTDFSRTFLPWEEGFSKGLYLAGVECDPEAQPPEGWVKWDIPGYVYIMVKCSHDRVFPQMIAWLEENGLPLVGAVQEYTDPNTGAMFLCFPIQELE